MIAEADREAKKNRHGHTNAFRRAAMSNAITRTSAGLALLLALLSASVLAAQSSAPAAATASGTALVIKGAVKQEVSLALADLKALPRTKLSAKGHDGAMHEYEGVPLQALLAKAGVPAAGDLRGKSMALFVVAQGGDGYSAVFSLAELDADFAAESVLVADTADGKELGADQGPLRLVVPGDKRQGRWVRMFKTIVVANAAP
jgi:DMSO/TMAO reductase YedYZ molybdopterin-dependent catalytic subunit